MLRYELETQFAEDGETPTALVMWVKNLNTGARMTCGHYPIAEAAKAAEELVEARSGKRYRWFFAIPFDIQQHWGEEMDDHIGQCMIGTGGGFDYCMIRGKDGRDYILCDADDAGAPEGLDAPACVYAFSYEILVHPSGEIEADWEHEGQNVFTGTARECIQYMKTIEGEPRGAREYDRW